MFCFFVLYDWYIQILTSWCQMILFHILILIIIAITNKPTPPRIVRSNETSEIVFKLLSSRKLFFNVGSTWWTLKDNCEGQTSFVSIKCLIVPAICWNVCRSWELFVTTKWLFIIHEKSLSFGKTQGSCGFVQI